MSNDALQSRVQSKSMHLSTVAIVTIIANVQIYSPVADWSVLSPANAPVLAQHQHPEGVQALQPGHVTELVVVEVQEDQPLELGEVLHPEDPVVLQVEQTQPVHTAQLGARLQTAPEPSHTTHDQYTGHLRSFFIFTIFSI